jgi:CheY-like chemotaxis protein
MMRMSNPRAGHRVSCSILWLPVLVDEELSKSVHVLAPARSADSQDMEPEALDGSSTLNALRQQNTIPEFPYVLVVDDQQIVRDFLKRSLEGTGFAVKQAGTAIIALEIMTTAPASVVLCDVRMPINDGLWLAERLRARWPDVPVIMITAIEDEDTIAACRRLGAFDYLTKPISQKQLREAIRKAMATLEDPVPEALEAPTSTLTELQTALGKIDAEYSLECPVRCPACGDTVSSLKAVRLLRAHVNFTSTLPRRGRLVVCPNCLAVVPAELSNF